MSMSVEWSLCQGKERRGMEEEQEKMRKVGKRDKEDEEGWREGGEGKGREVGN